MSSVRLSIFVVFVIGSLAITGCGDSLKIAEVEGTVKMNGKPVDKIQVEFWPVTSAPRSIGTTDAQGRYKMMTDDGKRNGAVIGSHKVVLHDVGILGEKFLGRAGEDVDMSQGKKPRISGNYADPEKTTLTKVVVAGKKNEIDLEVLPFDN